MNSCEEHRQWLLEVEWPEGDWQRAVAAAAHLPSCPACSAAAADFSRMRSLLKNENQGAPLGGWSAFEQRLIDRTLHRTNPPRWGWLALAASVLIAIGGYGVGRWTDRPVASTVSPTGAQAPGSGQASAGALSQADIDGRVKAFHEISGVFENRAAWLLVGDNTSDMGVSNDKIDHEHQVFLLRLTMLKSKRTISTADLVILPGQAASLTVPTDESSSLRYRIRVSQDQPARMMISAQLLTATGAEALAALETTLQIKPGQKLSAGNMVTTSGDYELQIAFGSSDLGQTDRASNQ